MSGVFVIKYQTGRVVYLQCVHFQKVLVITSASLQCTSFRPILFVSVISCVNTEHRKKNLMYLWQF